MTIKILSLFDGISGCRQALRELDIDCKYYSSEIDRYAIQIAKTNHPDIIHLGDVEVIGITPMNTLNNPYKRLHNHFNLEIDNSTDTPAWDFDLLAAGFPCQNLSIAGNKKGLKGEQSSLFFEALRILKEVKPRYFLFENVFSMSKANKDIISKELGVEPIMINSALLTAQQRKRLYWVGKLVNDKYEKVDISQPKDKGILLKDIIESGYTERDKAYPITATYANAIPRDYLIKKQRQLIYVNQYNLRKLTPTECEELQGYPKGYTSSVSNSQRYKALGNSFTVPVIKHILQQIL